MIDYIRMMQEYFGLRHEGFLTDNPMSIQFSDDDYVHVRYDVQTMRWIANRPSRIKYPTARKLIKQYRKEYAEKLG